LTKDAKNFLASGKGESPKAKFHTATFQFDEYKQTSEITAQS